MPTAPTKPLIVISYAHEDEPEKPAEGEVKWLSFVTGYLRPAIKHGAVDLWLDRLMPGGADWEREIQQKLRACDIFILLVSRHSLSSDCVVDKEIAIIRERQANGEDVHFYPMVLTPTPKIALDLVRDKNLRPRDGRPFSDYSLNERYRHMADAADEIAEIARQTTRRKRTSSAASTNATPSAGSEVVDELEFEDQESINAWLKEQRQEVSVTIAARAALRVLPLTVEAEEPGFTALSKAFRATVLARVASKYPARAHDLAAATGAAARAVRNADASLGAGDAARAAAEAADAARAPDAALAALYACDAALSCAVGLATLARGKLREERFSEAAWDEVIADIKALRAVDVRSVADGPLWSRGAPSWAKDAWSRLKAALPQTEDWDVWFDWYEERLRGASRGEDHELVFANVPQEEWDKGPAAANAWIRQRLDRRADRSSLGRPQQTRLRFESASSIADWLEAQSAGVAITLAARATLRAVPLLHRDIKKGRSSRAIQALAGVVFRGAALARVTGKYPTRHPPADRSEAYRAAGARAAAAREAAARETAATVAATATVDAAARAAAAASAFYYGVEAIVDNAALAAQAAANAAIAAHTGRASSRAARVMWEEMEADALLFESPGTSGGVTADSPLWSREVPIWAENAWRGLKAFLIRGEGWAPWIDWYEERLTGGSHGKAYELIFATVPLNVWDEGPAAANAWIKAHLPTVPELTRPIELPQALSALDAPFAYGWTASLRVAAIAGAQNLPFYPHFSSEEDHRRALEACRVGGGRLLKALRDGRYNARPEYGEALEYYLDDLPKTAGAGNILLANDQVRILHAMFLADAAMLSEGFTSRLKGVIANQFALNAFYDLVQRHNEAVSAGNWSQPFPIDAAKGFFGAVEDNTPRWFEPQVERGLRQVEQAEPRAAAAVPEPAPASAIEPPPLPPGTPDAQDSWRRQMATAANALWETFLQGRDMPVAENEWRKAADELGAHVRPILDFLRAQEERKA